MSESSPSPRRRAEAAELRRLNEIDRADALVRAWIDALPYGRRYVSGRVMGERSQREATLSAIESDGHGRVRVVAMGVSTRGLSAAMVDLARRLEPSFRAAETQPAPDGGLAPITIPAPALVPRDVELECAAISAELV